jgi:hypothetical protein
MGLLALTGQTSLAFAACFSFLRLFSCNLKVVITSLQTVRTASGMERFHTAPRTCLSSQLHSRCTYIPREVNDF